MSRLSRNIAQNVLGNGGVLLLNLIATRVVYRQLGAEILGLITFTYVVSSAVVSAADFGMTTTLVREVSMHWEREPDYVRDIVRTASFIAWSFTAVFIAAFVLFTDAILTSWIRVEHPTPEVARAIQLFGVSALLTLPRMIYGGVVQGLQRFGANNAADLGSGVLLQVGTWWLAARGAAIETLAWWYVASAAAGTIATALAFVGPLGPRALVPRLFPSTIKRNARFASNTLLTSMLASVYSRLDRLVVSHYTDIGTLGCYGFAASLSSKPMLIVSSVARATFPPLAQAYRDGDQARMAAQFRKVDDLICIGTLPMFAVVAFAARPLVAYTFDANIAALTFWPAVILAVGSYMNATLQIANRVALAVDRPQIASRANALVLFVVPVSILLAAKFGLVGAASSWVVYHLFHYAYTLPRYCRECVQTPFGAHLARLVKIFALAAIAYGGAGLATSGIRPSVIGSAVGFALGSVAFLGAAFVLVASPEFKAAVAGMATRFRRAS